MINIIYLLLTQQLLLVIMLPGQHVTQCTVSHTVVDAEIGDFLEVSARCLRLIVDHFGLEW